MFAKRILENEEAAIGLPVRIVVLTIIGLVGMYAMLYAVLNAPLVPGYIYATADNTSFDLPGGHGDSPLIRVHVCDSNDRPVNGANVVLWCPSRQRAIVGVTGPDGTFEGILTNITLPVGKSEGYIAIKVMHEGCVDHSNDFLVKVRKE